METAESQEEFEQLHQSCWFSKGDANSCRLITHEAETLSTENKFTEESTPATVAP